MRASMPLSTMLLLAMMGVPAVAGAQAARVPTGGTDGTFGGSTPPTVGNSPVNSSFSIYIPPPAPPPAANPKPPAITSFFVSVAGAYYYKEIRRGMGSCAPPTSINGALLWPIAQGNPASYYTVTLKRNGYTWATTVQASSLVCDKSNPSQYWCGPKVLTSPTDAAHLIPEAHWDQFLYTRKVVNGSSVTFNPWVANMDVTLDACNSSGCTRSRSTGSNLKVVSLGTADCTAGEGGTVYYPATALP